MAEVKCGCYVDVLGFYTNNTEWINRKQLTIA